jgi:FAD/FMN-containing dehydrogenase
MKLGGWGRFPRIECPAIALRDPADAEAVLRTRRSLIARGNGRSYGDPALNRDGVLSTLHSDRILAFDAAAGRITCEAGLTLAELLRFAVPRGYFPPVTPGTKFVTLGGMLAADVHGKNHHVAGSFGRHVEEFTLLTADGAVRRCAADENADLYLACQGGMGLLGVILDLTFRLQRIETAEIRQETLRGASLDEVMALCEASADWTYTVAWIDSLSRHGRALLYRGEHARAEERPFAPLAVPQRRARPVPLELPTAMLNRWTVRAFNELYWRRGKPGTAFVDYDTYFYPLDAVLAWNRIYGPDGFTQYQCVFPSAASRAGVTEVLRRMAASGNASFLSVLKLLGPSSAAPLSFPMAGYTLTLDFPATPSVLNLLLELDAVVADHGGRLYLAKDARMGPAMLRRGYPGLDAFRALRERYDPTRKFASLQSERLGL